MEVADEVAVSSVVPTVTVTDTPPSESVSPVIVNPATCSAMFTVSSPAMASRFSTSVPCGTTLFVTDFDALKVSASLPVTSWTAFASSFCVGSS